MRIAFFGGTFDPPHKGHIELADNVLQNDVCDRITFIPAWVPPHKTSSQVTAFEHRLAMLKLAVEPYPDMNVSNIEFREQRVPSYTLDTMRSLRRELPDDELMMLIGSDSLRQLHTWYRAEELVAEFKIITYPRPGEAVSRGELLKHWHEDQAEKLFSGLITKLEEFDLSSTTIRRTGGNKSRGMVSEKVNEYINVNSLY
jgi:nicotinate-nucleotide adenylyltransferase